MTDPDPSVSWRARAFVLGGLVIALVATVLSVATGTGVRFLGGVWFSGRRSGPPSRPWRAPCGGGSAMATGPPSEGTSSRKTTATGSTGRPKPAATPGSATSRTGIFTTRSPFAIMARAPGLRRRDRRVPGLSSSPGPARALVQGGAYRSRRRALSWEGT